MNDTFNYSYSLFDVTLIEWTSAVSQDRARGATSRSEET
jgi:hypothetical protein